MDNETNIDTVAEYFDSVRGPGVWVGGHAVESKGEGRATRYFVDGERASKDEVRALFDEARESGEAILVADDSKVRCKVCGALVGYLTGSHMGTHEDDEPQTVAAYREVFGEDAPLAPTTLSGRFEEWGAEASEADYDFSSETARLWAEGAYDHLRKEA